MVQNFSYILESNTNVFKKIFSNQILLDVVVSILCIETVYAFIYNV